MADDSPLASALRYFAYGSNLSLARLRARVPSAQRVGTFCLPGHELRFHKAGADGSAKCDAFYSENPRHAVYGSLFEIHPAEKYHLDRAEGLGWGYEEKTVLVLDNAGIEVEAFTYCALRVDASLKPYSWYLNHVLAGARESQLPPDYIRRIELVEAMEDTDSDRDRTERALHSVAPDASSQPPSGTDRCAERFNHRPVRSGSR